jgi:hypothetical protein
MTPMVTPDPVKPVSDPAPPTIVIPESFEAFVGDRDLLFCQGEKQNMQYA